MQPQAPKSDNDVEVLEISLTDLQKQELLKFIGWKAETIVVKRDSSAGGRSVTLSMGSRGPGSACW
jgi:hypothetical protein